MATLTDRRSSFTSPNYSSHPTTPRRRVSTPNVAGPSSFTSSSHHHPSSSSYQYHTQQPPATPSLEYRPFVPPTPSINCSPADFAPVITSGLPATPSSHHSGISVNTASPSSPILATPHSSPAQLCSQFMSAIHTRASMAVSSLAPSLASSIAPAPAPSQHAPPTQLAPAMVVEESGSSSHRRSRSRDFWANWGFSGSLPKVIQKEEEDDRMEVDSVDSAISIVLPPSLPSCSLSAAFQCSDTNTDIPPAFYPGQAIPTILTFHLDRYASLPHALHPTLTMSLVGTLHTPASAPRTIICVSVSLAEGLALWARDASHAYASRAGKEGIPDTTLGLPGGTYSLPLTVQVPSTPRLPPTFTVDGASFAVTYALTVTLACDDPSHVGNRVVLAESARPFEMMPETMPTRTPRFAPQQFWVRMDNESTPGALGMKGCPRRPNHRWTVTPILPTTAFSPTSTIPLGLDILPPPESGPEDRYLVLIRLSLLRREHSSLASGAVDPNTSLGLVAETEVSVRWTWLELQGDDLVKLDHMEVPIMVPGIEGWKHGYSTHLNVGPASTAANTNTPDQSVSVSSTFHLCATLAFLPIPTDLSGLQLLKQHLPPQALPLLPLTPGVLTTPESPAVQAIIAAKLHLTPPVSHSSLPMQWLKRYWPGTVKTLPLPLVIGSVAEPRGAMHISRWSDLHIDRASATGQGESGRMIYGESMSCEDGWIVPPPGYEEACNVVPYVYG